LRTGFSVPDWQTSLSRFISAFLIGLLFGAIYQKQKRLLPLIIAHWAIDFVGLGLFLLLWRCRNKVNSVWLTPRPYHL